MTRVKSYPADLSDRLVAGAYERLRTDVAEHVSLRELAASEGTSTNAIYSIFGGKDGLIAEVVLAARHDFVERQWAVLTENPTLDSLRASGHAYRSWAREHPALYRLVFGGGAERAAGIAYSGEILEPLRHVLGKLMEEGLVRETPLEPLCLSVLAATHGFVLLEMDLWPQGSPDADDLYDLHLSTLAQGFLAPHLHGAPGA